MRVVAQVCPAEATLCIITNRHMMSHNLAQVFYNQRTTYSSNYFFLDRDFDGPSPVYKNAAQNIRKPTITLIEDA